MDLDVKEILERPGGEIPFDLTVDADDDRVPDGIRVEGAVRNEAGALILGCRMEGELHLVCDRCLKSYTLPHVCEYETMLSEELENGDSEDIVLLEDGSLTDAGELFRQEFLLSLPTRNLCRPDCRGLCPKCGADLNEGPCGCPKDVDPRLEGLAGYFEKHPKD